MICVHEGCTRLAVFRSPQVCEKHVVVDMTIDCSCPPGVCRMEHDAYTRCKICNPRTSTVAISPGMVAGHCGKCGAPYTYDPPFGTTQSKFTPSCKCWNT
jgi:hypothetical protein